MVVNYSMHFLCSSFEEAFIHTEAFIHWVDSTKTCLILSKD